jgi:hypothetical protein
LERRLKDYLEKKGITGLIGSKDASRAGFKKGLVENGDGWMKRIEVRNLTDHTSDPKMGAWHSTSPRLTIKLV